MLSRRNFVKAVAAASVLPLTAGYRRNAGFGPLIKDPDGILDLPEGFSYRIIAKFGDEMSDGLLVPALADGMAAFPRSDGRVSLVCNHELGPSTRIHGAFGRRGERLDRFPEDYIYDRGSHGLPSGGGTTTLIYDPASGEVERQFLSLAGTEINCAGGPTPWGSWLSCEESFFDPGPSFRWDITAHRLQRHGYVFEVPADSDGPVKPVPLVDMGRFEHEAAAVDPESGIVYLTEDRHRSLFYRYLPNTPGQLADGGQLQALAFVDGDRFDTRNWSREPNVELNKWYDTRWVDLEDVDGIANDLRLRGGEAGAAMFARGEGLCFADGSAFITSTIGGPHKMGQVFEYRLSPVEGQKEESAKRGRIRLLAECSFSSVMRRVDNLTMSPWGDLVICEDYSTPVDAFFGVSGRRPDEEHDGLACLTPDGQQYRLARNALSTSELAGVCFSPDGKTLFVNIQDEGLTVAINGPFPG